MLLPARIPKSLSTGSTQISRNFFCHCGHDVKCEVLSINKKSCGTTTDLVNYLKPATGMVFEEIWFECTYVCTYVRTFIRLYYHSFLFSNFFPVAMPTEISGLSKRCGDRALTDCPGRSNLSERTLLNGPLRRPRTQTCRCGLP